MNRRRETQWPCDILLCPLSLHHWQEAANTAAPPASLPGHRIQPRFTACLGGGDVISGTSEVEAVFLLEGGENKQQEQTGWNSRFVHRTRRLIYLAFILAAPLLIRLANRSNFVYLCGSLLPILVGVNTKVRGKIRQCKVGVVYRALLLRLKCRRRCIFILP